MFDQVLVVDKVLITQHFYRHRTKHQLMNLLHIPNPFKVHLKVNLTPSHSRCPLRHKDNLFKSVDARIKTVNRRLQNNILKQLSVRIEETLSIPPTIQEQHSRFNQALLNSHELLQHLFREELLRHFLLLHNSLNQASHLQIGHEISCSALLELLLSEVFLVEGVENAAEILA